MYIGKLPFRLRIYDKRYKIMEQLKALIQPEKEFATEGELIVLFAFNKSTLAKMRMNNEIPYYKFGGNSFIRS